jgi:hypothetical protein
MKKTKTGALRRENSRFRKKSPFTTPYSVRHQDLISVALGKRRLSLGKGKDSLGKV